MKKNLITIHGFHQNYYISTAKDTVTCTDIKEQLCKEYHLPRDSLKIIVGTSPENLKEMTEQDTFTPESTPTTYSTPNSNLNQKLCLILKAQKCKCHGETNSIQTQ